MTSVAPPSRAVPVVTLPCGHEKTEDLAVESCARGVPPGETGSWGGCCGCDCWEVELVIAIAVLRPEREYPE